MSDKMDVRGGFAKALKQSAGRCPRTTDGSHVWEWIERSSSWDNRLVRRVRCQCVSCHMHAELEAEERGDGTFVLLSAKMERAPS